MFDTFRYLALSDGAREFLGYASLYKIYILKRALVIRINNDIFIYITSQGISHPLYQTLEIVHTLYLHCQQKIILWYAHGTYHHHHGSQNQGHRNFESTFKNVIRIIKNWNWLTLKFLFRILKASYMNSEIRLDFFEELMIRYDFKNTNYILPLITSFNPWGYFLPLIFACFRPS